MLDSNHDVWGMDIASYCSRGIPAYSIFGSLVGQVIYYLFTHEKINT